MMKYLRFQGAAVFILIVSLIALCFYLFAEFFIKKGIETSVEWYTGAEVNVAEVELDYSPLTLAVLGFQATDAENPQQNIVEFKQAKVSLEFWQYLFGKVIIDDLIIDGLSFSSPRTKVGEVYQKTAELNQTAETEQSTSLSDEVKKNLPDPKKLLEDSDLLTVKASNALTEAYKVETVKLKAIKEQLPTKEKLAKYQEDVKALAKIKVKSLEDLEQIKSQYDELKKQFKADKAIVKEAKQTLANTQTVLTERVTALKNAPGEDWRQIEKTYQLDKIDSADFAHILFGEQAREYYETAQMVYEKLSPLISSEPTEQEVKKEAAEGRFVFFQEDDPLPELLIKNALFSVIMPQGDFAITIEEFTHQHWLRNKPTLYSVVSDNIGQSGDVKLTGTFILSEQKQFNANGQWQLSDMKLSQAKLRDTKNLSLMLKEGFLFGHGAYKLDNTTIDSSNEFTINNTSYEGKSDGHLGKLVLDTVSSIDSLALKINAMGALSNPTWRISSPLDKALKNALSQQLDAKVAEFKTQVQSKLNDKLTESLKLQDGKDSALLDLDALLTDSDNALDSLLDSDVVKQKEKELKQKAEDKVKDKVKDKLGGLFK